MQHCGFNTPLGRIFSGRRDFSLGVNMSSDSILRNSFRWEYKPWSSLCSRAFHRTDSKDPDLGGWHIQHAPSMKTECDYFNGWIKNSHIHKNLTKMVNPRDIAGERRRRRRRQLQQECLKTFILSKVQAHVACSYITALCLVVVVIYWLGVYFQW